MFGMKVHSTFVLHSETNSMTVSQNKLSKYIIYFNMSNAKHRKEELNRRSADLRQEEINLLSPRTQICAVRGGQLRIYTLQNP